jgi:hypothetical protein
MKYVVGYLLKACLEGRDAEEDQMKASEEGEPKLVHGDRAIPSMFNKLSSIYRADCKAVCRLEKPLPRGGREEGVQRASWSRGSSKKTNINRSIYLNREYQHLEL